MYGPHGRGGHWEAYPVAADVPAGAARRRHANAPRAHDDDPDESRRVLRPAARNDPATYDARGGSTTPAQPHTDAWPAARPPPDEGARSGKWETPVPAPVTPSDHPARVPRDGITAESRGTVHDAAAASTRGDDGARDAHADRTASRQHAHAATGGPRCLVVSFNKISQDCSLLTKPQMSSGQGSRWLIESATKSSNIISYEIAHELISHMKL